MEKTTEDTICGIATPVGEGGIGVVRVSGPDALAVASRVVRLRSKRGPASLSSHRLYVADIVSGSALGHSGGPTDDAELTPPEIIDEGLVVWMKAPHSYTGEDVVELHCHGSQVVLRLVCEACIRSGARLAEPGEFTKRAFLNGRLDLSQAEAVLETIRASSEAALRLAQRNLRGELGLRANQLRGRLLSLLCEVEAGIDFGEEDISFIQRDQLVSSLEETLADVERILGCAALGRRLREGARVTIVGPPNVGKSSLLNVLLGEDRAIVTDVPGTTRDVIEESVVWDGVVVTLIDTAGVRETDDVVEQEGIKRTRSAVEQSDLVLSVLDASAAGAWSDWCLPLPIEKHQRLLLVLNKSDLAEGGVAAEAADTMARRLGVKTVVTSVRTGMGIDDLRQVIREELTKGVLEPKEGVVFINARHRHALERARVSLEEALDSIRSGRDAEFVAVDLRGASDALGEITGAITSDEILNRIFSTFCIGK
ncbi:MAG: tRNA uridine-5-carboxymethylaminomethyl(34) synthesis GTPase MnmE [Nitrospira sp.]|nr:tRNA uridine-5-carboxymethylaminomethyl(34) synthesis GTPase MnmE [Nitrospira sp.]MCP9461040.1 tRNA uridine-5-carboxymethylaminomethyl(34) synthesis GTPase MnmE [Nitrospira sp.]MCP9474053.1 tRNA uridine-5-carboxymethylaminomethyl(34) synthesis GTPase MnmE [Nitrospira sp.]